MSNSYVHPGPRNTLASSVLCALTRQACRWLNSGPALEERFVIHTLAEFEQWVAKAPTKFDHPVAHEEIKRFAHGTFAR